MRFLAIVMPAVLAAVAMPGLALADPGQTEAAHAVDAQSVASATATPTSGTSTTTPSPAKVQEVVKVSPPAETDNLDEIVCKTSPPATGTRLGGSRECHTQRDWKARQQQAQDMLAHDQASGMQQPLRTQ